MAILAGLGALGLAIVGGAVSSHSTNTQPANSSSAFPSSSAGSPPSHTTAAAPVLTTSAAPPSPATALTISCPSSNVASPVFGHTIAAAALYLVDIDYGDGDHYSNTDQHLDAVFTHTYGSAGRFSVTAVVTDATGQKASSSCGYTWKAAAPAPKQAPVPAGGAGGNTYTNSDGNRVPGPVSAPAAPPGATAHCNDGTWSFSQHRQGTCSGHGGVASWLN